MNLRSLMAVVTAVGTAAVVAGCDSGPSGYQVEGEINRISTFSGNFGDKGGTRFSVGDDIRTYTCHTEKISECASLRDGDIIKMRVVSVGEEKVETIESVKKAPSGK